MTAIFNALVEGGSLKGPFHKQPQGGETGWLADKFGVNWTITIEEA